MHTIKRLFPSLETKDYLEIGRMCMTEEMPKNSESQMISDCIKWLKHNRPHLKVLFTWADGMMGKPGYVYQACNFYYAGYSQGEFYLKDNIKIHPRQTRYIFSPNDKRKTVRPTLEQMRDYNIIYYKGKQFRYFTFLCGKLEKRKLLKECNGLVNQYPKEKDITFKKKDLISGKWVNCPMPYVKTDWNQDNSDVIDNLMELNKRKGAK